MKLEGAAVGEGGEALFEALSFPVLGDMKSRGGNLATLKADGTV